MPFVMFHSRFPEIAERETRTIKVLPWSKADLPWGEYAFLEMFCDEQGCDCRRVFFSVVSSRTKNIEAVLAYGWEPPSFYATWMRNDDPHTVAGLKGPTLNSGSPQSKWAPSILELFKTVLLSDSAYMDRVIRHYKLFRDHIDRPKRNKIKKRA